MALEQGNLAEARARFEEAASLLGELGDLNRLNGGWSDLAGALRRLGHTDEALALYHETLRAWQHMRHCGAIAHQLDLAFIAIARAQPTCAVRLLGAAKPLRDLSGALMRLPEPAEYDQALAELRAQLPPAEIDAAWAEGRAIGMDEAIEHALEEKPQTLAPDERQEE